MKKYLAEMIGTGVLVFMGCGTAMLAGCDAVTGGYILTAFAFGLAVTAMTYCAGNISGGHFNGAVTFAMLIRKKIGITDAVMYWVFQIFGALVGAGLLSIIFNLGSVKDMTGAFGSNGLTGVNGNVTAGILVEIILTFVFVMTIQGVKSEKFKHGSVAGLIIGLALTLVHILGIGLTGTSVNPSRSIGPAVVAAVWGNYTPAAYLWIFIVGPLIGAALAALVYPFFDKVSWLRETQKQTTPFIQTVCNP